MRLAVVHDEELVARIVAGDRRALADLYERHRGPLAAFLRVYTADQDLIEEVTQDTMLAAWKGASRFAGRSSVRSWLFAIARRRAADVLRRKSIPITGVEVLDRHADPQPGPEGHAIAQATQDELMGAISALSAIHREVLMLVFVHELSYQEAASVIDIPVGTVKSRLNAARMALRTGIRKEDQP